MITGLGVIAGAAVVGRLVRFAAGWLAQRSGHSPRKAQEAVATSGLSLVVERRDKGPFEPQSLTTPGAPHPVRQ